MGKRTRRSRGAWRIEQAARERPPHSLSLSLGPPHPSMSSFLLETHSAKEKNESPSYLSLYSLSLSRKLFR